MSGESVHSETGDANRFRISALGWMGIAAIALGVAYFVLLPDGADEAVERKVSPPEAKGNAGRKALSSAAKDTQERSIAESGGDTRRAADGIRLRPPPEPGAAGSGAGR